MHAKCQHARSSGVDEYEGDSDQWDPPVSVGRESGAASGLGQTKWESGPIRNGSVSDRASLGSDPSDAVRSNQVR